MASAAAHWGRSKAWKLTPKIFDLLKIRAKSLIIGAKFLKVRAEMFWLNCFLFEWSKEEFAIWKHRLASTGEICVTTALKKLLYN